MKTRPRDCLAHETLLCQLAEEAGGEMKNATAAAALALFGDLGRGEQSDCGDITDCDYVRRDEMKKTALCNYCFSYVGYDTQKDVLVGSQLCWHCEKVENPQMCRYIICPVCKRRIELEDEEV